MPDFTFHTFKKLLKALKEQQYAFQSFVGFLKNPAPRAIILRHDVDARKLNSLHAAKLEAELGISGTFNFRMVSQSFDPEVIREIAALGHEIGYHYEDLSTVKGNYEEAIKSFEQNLAKLRHIVPIETICMHGSPLSKYDNRKIWERYNYKRYGIIGEPYFDLDFSQMLYLTDTGRRWDGEKVSIRDKVSGERERGREGEGVRERIESQTSQSIFHSTFDIIHAASQGKLPDKIMITIHPQRWEDRPLPWIRELVFQNCKNVIKSIIAGR